MARRCWVNFQYRGVLLIWITVGQGPIVLAVGAGGGCLDIFSLIYQFSFLSPSLWETVRYRLKYCLKGPLSPKQPTNQRFILFVSQGGSELRILTVLFGICLFARSVIRSVILMAYVSILSFCKASQLVSASSREKVA